MLEKGYCNWTNCRFSHDEKVLRAARAAKGKGKDAQGQPAGKGPGAGGPAPQGSGQQQDAYWKAKGKKGKKGEKGKKGTGKGKEQKGKGEPEQQQGESRVWYPDKLCKYIGNGQVCPDGKNCHYSHDLQHFDGNWKPKRKKAKEDGAGTPREKKEKIRRKKEA